MSLPPFPSAAVIRELVRYEPETGKLFWLERPARYFSEERFRSTWNTAHAGKEAFLRLNADGYLVGTLLGVPRTAHRIAWLTMKDALPLEIDHINGTRSDNRWLNLRASMRSMNAKNQKVYRHNTSGVTGVSRTKNGTWRAQISTGKSRKISLGSFPTIEEAAKARREAEARLGYAPEHGQR